MSKTTATPEHPLFTHETFTHRDSSLDSVKVHSIQSTGWFLLLMVFFYRGNVSFTHGVVRLGNMHAPIACGFGVTASSNWVSLGLDACVLFLQHAPCLGGCAFLQWLHRGALGMGCEIPGPRPACSQSCIPACQVVPKCRVAVPGRAVQHGEGSRVPPRG